ncbi:ATP-binding protein [Pseudomonas sp. 148P]|uniref:histidine kinase n=1 Tax=Pseudomonas ulcerans TaxID=3115852 RepID=A0ABU7HNP3_9PSED|nr:MULTISPECIES: ATP-binding protein [unclassified Pseudomonas]MEE1923654.1 ATP-binding protein [Pseudomonas sp. 147P]MEE1933152.1 ATP-binding protein [Pseudomonas sp. 148P]
MDGFKGRLSGSLQLRLSLALSLAILLVAVMTGLFTYRSAYDEALDFQDNGLRQVAELIARQHMTFTYPAADELDGVSEDDEETRIVIQLLADGAKVVPGDDSQLPLPIPGDIGAGLSTVQVGDEPFRVLVASDATGQRFVVAQEIHRRNRDARNSAWRALLPFAILFPILLLVVADLIRKLLRPVTSVAASLDSRDDQDLRPVDDQALASEIRPFVHAINRLLQRVARSLDSQKRFVADAAHELRTPLTALSLQVEALEAEALPERARTQVALVRRGISRSRKLIEQLLSLASAQLAEQERGSVSVHAVCRQVLADLMPLVERKQVDIGVEGEDVQLALREVELQAILKNLLENALRHVPQAGQVDVLLLRSEAFVEICVRDDGPGIDPQEWERVFDPFYRSPGNQEEGSGLGLSIVQTIVQRSGGAITAGYADAGARQGWQVCLRWPVE